MDQVVRVGIISDSLLQQHLLQSVIEEKGYQIAVNTHPEKLNKAILLSETISMWIVDIIDESFSSEFLDSLFDHVAAPVFIGEGISPDRNSEIFPGWKRRLLGKLTEISPPTRVMLSGPEMDFSKFANVSKSKEVAPLPDYLKNIPSTDVNEIWVIAASLGGPEAVKEFFDTLPGDIPAAFLYAQHIDLGCVDSLVASIGRHTALDMQLITQGVQVENSKILVVPVDHEIDFHPNHSVEIMDASWSGPYGPSIDHLLKNTVERYGSKTNLIVFSGMGSDGTLGATLVQESGGKVWSQSTESAIQPSMPDSVSDLDCVSFRGNPSDLAKKVVIQLSENHFKTSIFTD